MAEDAAYRSAAPTPPPLPEEGVFPPAAQPEVGFQNDVAVRVGLLMAVPAFFFTSILASLPGIGPVLMVVGLFGAGFLSVAVYKQRTGAGLTVMSGARMGWICGVFLFLIALVSATITYALAPDFGADFQETLRKQGQSPENIKQAMQALRSPAVILLILSMLFSILTVLPSLGGAFGAKIFDSKPR